MDQVWSVQHPIRSTQWCSQEREFPELIDVRLDVIHDENGRVFTPRLTIVVTDVGEISYSILGPDYLVAHRSRRERTWSFV